MDFFGAKFALHLLNYFALSMNADYTLPEKWRSPPVAITKPKNSKLL